MISTTEAQRSPSFMVSLAANSARETNLIAGQGFASMVAADFNRDGQPDLLFTNGHMRILWFYSRMSALLP